MDEITIKVTAETLVSVSDDVEQKISKVQNAFEQLESVVQGSLNYWEGMGQSSFYQAYRIRKDDYMQILTSFKEHIVNLKQIAGVYQKAESDAVDISQKILPAVIE